MNYRFNQVGTLGKTHRAEPQEPIVPRYEPSNNPLSLSQPEPYRIDTPRFEPITFKPIAYKSITLSLPTPVTPDFSQFSWRQTSPTTPLVHQDDLEEEIYEADPSLVEEYKDDEPIVDLEEETPIEDPEVVDYNQTPIEINPELVESEAHPSSTIESNLETLKVLIEQWAQKITQFQIQFTQSNTLESVDLDPT